MLLADRAVGEFRREARSPGINSAPVAAVLPPARIHPIIYADCLLTEIVDTGRPYETNTRQLSRFAVKQASCSLGRLYSLNAGLGRTKWQMASQITAKFRWYRVHEDRKRCRVREHYISLPGPRARDSSRLADSHY
jgi:hypothetical protein